jgi:undecaprenyl-diphosphatase
MHSLVTFVAKYFIIVPFLCALAIFIHLPNKQRVRFVIFGAITGVVAIVLAKIGSHFYYDPRPFVAHHTVPYFPHGNDNGFPSDHTLLSFILAFAAVHFDKRLGWIALITAAMVGCARVVAGVHHVSDVVGAVVFAGVGAITAAIILSSIDARTSNRQADTPKRS